MTQHLLAVHHAGTRADLPREEWRQSLADVGVFNARLTDACAFPLLAELQDEHSARRGAQ